MKKSSAFTISLLITLLVATDIYLLSNLDKVEKPVSRIKRVIDGDTLETFDGEVIRLENINTPERGIPGYEEAKVFLQQFENQSIFIHSTEFDKYGRTLAQLYNPDYLNLKIVSLGLGNKYLVNKGELKQFKEAEEKAIQNELGMWRRSSSFNCLQSEISPKKEIITLTNICPEINIMNWVIKDESRKVYKFPNTTTNKINIHTFQGIDNETDLFWGNANEIWNDDRDTLYIFDENWDFVHHNTYGY